MNLTESFREDRSRFAYSSRLTTILIFDLYRSVFFYIKIENPVSLYDAYPPAQVIDLLVTLVNSSDSNVSIAAQWTAPGDDLDFGSGTLNHKILGTRI